MNRRHFLKNSFASSLGLASIGAGVGSSVFLDAIFNTADGAIAPGGDDFKTLVVVNLNGGNDSLNMLIPTADTEHAQYFNARPSIAFKQSQLRQLNDSNGTHNGFGVGPRMSGVQDLFNNGHLSFVANVGSLVEPLTKAQFLARNRAIPEGLGGHNTQAAYWQADHSNRINTTRDGWGGRLANEFMIDSTLPTNLSIGAGRNILQSHQQQSFYNLGVTGLRSLRDFEVGNVQPGISARRKAINALNELAIKSSDPFQQHAGELFKDGLSLNQVLQTELANVPDLSSRFSPNQGSSGVAFSSNLANAAAMILTRRQLGMKRQILFVEHADYDTHTDHAERHGNTSEDLSTFLSEFNQIMVDEGVHDSVVTVTTSEFGRNLVSNGNGNDHGWGAQHMVMGGPVEGGQIFGTFPSLELDGDDDVNGSGRMLPTLSITQYGATLARWFGVPDNRMASVFPNIDNFGNRYIDFIT